MMRTRDQHLFDAGPKRILALDGGGVRGLITLGFLERVETILRSRASDKDGFRLSSYFDLIGGTSTGGIIATLLALGERVEDIRKIYLDLCPHVFRRPGLVGSIANPKGLFKSVFKSSAFAKEIDKVIDDYLARAKRSGQELKLESDLLQTGLAIVTKRIDTGSVWVLTNNPRSRYWDPNSPYWPLSPTDSRDWFANKDFHLKSLARATASAPYYLDAVAIDIDRNQRGLFLDGGASPFNNPAKALFLIATLKCFGSNPKERYSPLGFDWETGKDNLLMLSIGTGTWREMIAPKKYSAKWNAMKATHALMSMIDDGMKSSVTWLQALSEPAKPYRIDGELEDMRQMRILSEPLLTFQHVNVQLQKEWLKDRLGFDYSNGVIQRLFQGPDRVIKRLREMDNASPENLARLSAIGKAAGEKLISDEDFPKHFDVVA